MEYQYKLTKWKNPTKLVRTVTVFEERGNKNVPIKFTFQPDEVKEIPSHFDLAIQRVDCGRPECREKRDENGRPIPGSGPWCDKGHPGVVLGGLDPLLVRVGVEGVVVPEALDPEAAKVKALEAEQAAAMIAKKAAEEAILIAEAKKPKK